MKNRLDAESRKGLIGIECWSPLGLKRTLKKLHHVYVRSPSSQGNKIGSYSASTLEVFSLGLSPHRRRSSEMDVISHVAIISY